MNLWIALAATGGALLGIPWLIYPWGAITWASLKHVGQSKPIPPSRSVQKVSIVLATREPPDAVIERVQNLNDSDWPFEQREIIVAIDGDPGPYHLPELSDVIVVGSGSVRGKAAALDAGVGAATGEVLVFADTAQRFMSNTIRQLVEALTDGPYTAVSGWLTLGGESHNQNPLVQYWSLERRLRQAESKLHSAIGVSGAVYTMWRENWRPLPAGLILDDLWVPMQLILGGHRVGYSEEAVAFDTRATTPSREFRRKVRTLTGNFQLLAWMPEALAPWRNPVWIEFWCHKVLRLATPIALALAGIGIVGLLASTIPALLVWGVGLAIAAALLLAAASPPLARRCLSPLIWTGTLTAATFMAAWKGLRGDWDVWTR